MITSKNDSAVSIISVKAKKALRNWEVIGCVVVFIAGILLATWVSGLNAQPNIEIHDDLYKFGSVSSGQRLTHEFIVKNSGSKPLIISNALADCGCITEAKMIGTKVIDPHKEGRLQVTLETPSFRTGIHQAITVISNDPDTPKTDVVFDGEVNPKLSIDPALINFGIVEESDLPLKITSSLSGDSQGKITLGRSGRLGYTSSDLHQTKPGHWALSTTLGKESAIGPINEDLIVNPSWSEARRITIIGQVIGDIYSEPSEAFSMTRKEGKPHPVVILIKSRSDNITNIAVGHIDTSLNHLVSITIKHSKVPSNSASMRVEWNDQDDHNTRTIGNIFLNIVLSNGKKKGLVVPVTSIRLG